MKKILIVASILVLIIILDVKDNQKYLSAYSFQLFSTDGKEIKTIYYPENFIKLAFYHNNVLYNIDSKNNLVVFKFEKDVCNKYTFTNFTKGSLTKSL